QFIGTTFIVSDQERPARIAWSGGVVCIGRQDDAILRFLIGGVAGLLINRCCGYGSGWGNAILQLASDVRSQIAWCRVSGENLRPNFPRSSPFAFIEFSEDGRVSVTGLHENVRRRWRSFGKV